MHAPLCLGLLLLPNSVSIPVDDPVDVISALETAVADTIEKVQPSIVSVTRIHSPNGATMAVRGRTAVREDGTPLVSMPERPGFPNVGITADLTGQPSPDAFPLPGDFGGGVVIGKNGEILTNYSLIKGSAQIRVRGRGFVFDAEIIAADPRTDLAVIVPRPNATFATGFKPAVIGDSERLRQGSFLIALGNPYNAARDGKASASLGILSNTARKLDPSPSADINIRRLFKFQPTLMQLDSRLNLGMSGGAVVNIRGELVGLTTAGASPVGYDAAAGYAIPMDTLGRRAVDELRQGKEVEYSFIGIGLSSEPNTISQVQEGTPAWAANLQSGDRILAVGDIELADDDSALPLALARVPVGEPVHLKVRRQGTVIDRTLVMSKYPLGDEEGNEVIATNRPAPWRGAQIDFTSMLGDGQRTDQTLGVMRRGGIGVLDVASGSPAEAAGLQKGTVVKAVAGTPVSTPKQFRAVVAEFEGKPVELTILGTLESTQKVTVPAR